MYIYLLYHSLFPDKRLLSISTSVVKKLRVERMKFKRSKVTLLLISTSV